MSFIYIYILSYENLICMKHEFLAMPHYKLIYFNIYGRAETARFLFHLAGVPYEDVQYDVVTEWPDKKSGNIFDFMRCTYNSLLYIKLSPICNIIDMRIYLFVWWVRKIVHKVCKHCFLRLESRWGLLPELEVDGKKLAQTPAINQYLAKQFGMLISSVFSSSPLQMTLLNWADDRFVNS